MLALLLGAAMDLLDTSLVNTALPTVRRELHASAADLEWIVAGYTFAFAALLLTSGRLGDRYGYRRVFVVGCLAFGIASLGCSTASGAGVLVAWRCVAGAAAAVMMPQITSLLQAMYAPEERSGVLGLLGAVGGIGAALGPLAGAAILSADLTSEAWRPVFLVNVPLALAAAAAALLLVPHVPPAPDTRIDVRGALLSTLGFGLLVYGLIDGPDQGWSPRAWGAVAAAVPVIGLFVASQRSRGRAASGRPGPGRPVAGRPVAGRLVADPLTPGRLFAHRSFTGGIVLSVVVETVVGGLLLVSTLTLQTALGLSPLHAGLMTLPMTGGMVLGVAVLAELLLPRIGRDVIALGGLALTVGVAAGSLVVAVEGAGTVVWHLIPGLIVAGTGLGMIMGPLFAVTLNDVRAADAGAASGTLEAAEQVGSTLGVATIGSLFVSSVAHGLGSAYVHATGLAIALSLVIVCLARTLPARIRSEDEVRAGWAPPAEEDARTDPHGAGLRT
ncbi:hypothetical protein WN71_023730 [Streptomyces mangrovisoli]|uniref:Major facilitator superfamily (MFS) profile domain-containing protein n=1 Tax=Streptomyces mangrovisoli TaxID=1428628 RepID=A0A1J4NSI3_9ACTN|nr:hypothetical protein WN71_023730 [Streptomyces mangrovisoli]